MFVGNAVSKDCEEVSSARPSVILVVISCIGGCAILAVRFKQRGAVPHRAARRLIPTPAG